MSEQKTDHVVKLVKSTTLVKAIGKATLPVKSMGKAKPLKKALVPRKAQCLGKWQFAKRQ